MTLFSETNSKWPKVKFGDVVRNVDESVRDPQTCGLERYVGLEHIDPESLHIQRWGLIADGTSFTRRFCKGQVLFGKRRAYQRKVAVADFDGLCSSDILVFEPKDGRLLPELLPFICQTNGFFEHALDTSAGSLSPRTKFKELARYEFSLPPLDKQLSIAEILWAVDEAKFKHKIAEEESEKFRIAFIEEILEDQDAPKIVLGDVCKLQTGYPFKSQDFTLEGDRLLRCSNVGIGKCQWGIDDTKYWPENRRSEFKDYLLNIGDIVIAMDRPFIAEGFKIARIGFEDLPVLLLQRVGRFIASPKINIDYLWAYLHSKAFISHLQNNQQGTELPHISKFDVESAPIRLPPQERQKQIAYDINMISDSRSKLQENLNKLENMRKVLLTALLKEI